MDSSPRLLTDRDAAAYLSVSRATVHRLKADRQLQPVYIGQALRFDRQDLDAYIDAPHLEQGKDQNSVPELTQRFLVCGQQTRAGEWITYKDVAVVVRGDVLAARAVGQAMARHADVLWAHRVLGKDGTIPSGWRDGDAGPEECQRRLEDEGVTFTDGRADPSRRLSVEQLKRRFAAT